MPDGVFLSISIIELVRFGVSALRSRARLPPAAVASRAAASSRTEGLVYSPRYGAITPISLKLRTREFARRVQDSDAVAFSFEDDALNCSVEPSFNCK
ncbi:hypothetical protein EVAR_11667_1 [Eumeta japonica]|uniref:Uncharacterized protein n=1 Tax=Eumeta variegata TaxID=151549 RepID=A0A4C1U4K7_EUMVA|nr:hypothetical protein EVAR_11667_1 [Eumeta japonica]